MDQVRFITALTLVMVSAGGVQAAEPARSKAVVMGETVAGAQAPQVQRMLAAYRGWLGRWGISHSAIFVVANDGSAGSASIGAQRADLAAPITSLSKAITGVCITKLIEKKKFGFRSTLGQLIPDYFLANPPADARAKTITVGQLLTHSSGNTNDITQNNFPAGIDFWRTNMAPQLRKSLSEKLAATPGTTYFYNNVNYVALGLVIEKFAAGQKYEDFCRDTVLTPRGITTARLTPMRRVLGAYGGWQMSPADYARFLAYFNPNLGLLTIPPGNWPSWSFSDGGRYSIGIMYRNVASGVRNFWHAGVLRWNGASWSAYQVYMRNQVRYVATTQPAMSTDAQDDLDRVLWAAAFP